MALKGTINGSVTYKTSIFSYYLEWSISQNIASNYSDVTVKAYWKTTNTGNKFDTYSERTAYIIVNDGSDHKSTISKRFNCNPWRANPYLIMTYTVRVPHNSDGTSPKIKITGYANGTASASGTQYGPGNSNAAQDNIYFNTIPRTSAVSATNAYIESNSTITISRASSIFTHSLYWGTGSNPTTWNSIVSKTSAVSYAWKIPTSIYSLIPNAAQYKDLWIKCVTYSGNTEIGSSTCKITASCNPDICKPTLSGTMTPTDLSSLTGSADIIIKGVSAMAFTATASANKNAGSMRTITVICSDGQSATITNGGSRTLSAVKGTKFSIVAVDSRGISTTIEQYFSMVDYMDPTIIPNAARSEPTSDDVSIELNGDFFNGSFGTVDNAITVDYCYKKTSEDDFNEWATLTATADGNEWHFSGEITIADTDSYMSAYDFKFRIRDSIRTEGVIRQIILNKGIPVFDWGEHDFRFNVPVSFAAGFDTITKIEVSDLIQNVSKTVAADSFILASESGLTILQLHFTSSPDYKNTECNVATLPAEYKPSCKVFGSVADLSSIQRSYTYINSDGEVYFYTLSSGSDVALTFVFFRG